MLAIGLISILLLSVLFIGCIEEESQESPEDTFSLLVDRINDEDSEGVIELTDTQFVDDDIWEEVPEQQEEYEETIDDFQDAIDDGEMEIDSYEIDVTYLEDMDEENKTIFENLTETLNENEYFNATVDDFCLIEYDWEATIEEDSILKEWFEPDEVEEMDQMLGMLEIDDEWYLSFQGTNIILYEDVGDRGDDIIEPLAGTITHHNGTLFEVSVLAVPSSANPEDVKITVLDEDYGELDEGYIDQDDWLLLSDGEVVSGSRFDVDDISTAEITEEDIKEVVIRIEGYEGTISVEI